MTKCPTCGSDQSAPKRLVATSAKELVESLRLDAELCSWLARVDQNSLLDWSAELEAFKDRMRANGYRTNAGPVKDAHAAFRTHMRNAVKFANNRTAPKQPQRTFRTAAKKEE